MPNPWEGVLGFGGLTKLLIANRGEIAIRVMRAAEELGIEPVMVFSVDDHDSLHALAANSAHQLDTTGPSAYLDVEGLLAIARQTGCDGVHPGYGFLAENVEFARRCGEEGLTFVGPSVEVLQSLGDKSRARGLAAALDVPILSGSPGPVTIQEARDFRQQLGEESGLVIKAVAGGGGRGMRVVGAADDLDDAYSRCQSEAEAAFGSGAVYVEELVARARHLEVQIVGDGSGAVVHLGERECSVQRRHQKLVELTPCPTLSDEGRDALCSAAVALARSVSYSGVGTFEFLQEATAEGRFFFIEANPRIQVEHTVTEEVTGIDPVRLQLELAGGATLADLGLDQESVPAPRGHAIQARVNTVAASAIEPELAGAGGAGATLDKLDPLASLDFYRSGEGTRSMADTAPTIVGPPGTEPVPAPLQGTVVEIHVAEGDEVGQGQLLFSMSALKMEHDVKAPLSGVVRRLTVSVGETVYDDHVLAFIEPRDVDAVITEEVAAVEIDHVRPSLQALFDRRQFLLDENRPAAVERRHSRGRRTVRENISQLIDEDTWVEYGPLALAGQSARRSLDELIRKTPADGLVAGIGSVNGDLFDRKRARTMFISYDDTVFAGTQGGRGHDKTDRMMELANELSLPLIFHCEGAGGAIG
ncbi:MAG: biotin/lipoyl-binding protein [Acidimicrobiia bacterium]|nr:biotin/lipoyl-binding protein [Acidimicrobiia bacterium]